MVGLPPNHPFLMGFSIINHPFWGTPIFGNTHIAWHGELFGLGILHLPSIRDFSPWLDNNLYIYLHYTSIKTKVCQIKNGCSAAFAFSLDIENGYRSKYVMQRICHMFLVVLFLICAVQKLKTSCTPPWEMQAAASQHTIGR